MRRQQQESGCPLCGGERVPGKTTYSVDLGFGVVVVRDVPATVCNQCGEEWIGDGIALQLEKITEQARCSRHLVEVLSFSGGNQSIA